MTKQEAEPVPEQNNMPHFAQEEDIDIDGWFWRFGDLGRAYPNRQLARLVWTSTGLLFPGLFFLSVGLILGEFVLTALGVLMMLVFIAAIIMPLWPISVAGGEYLVLLNPGRQPVRFLEAGGQFIHWFQSLSHYSYDESLRCDFSNMPSIPTPQGILFQLKGHVEFRFNPTQIEDKKQIRRLFTETSEAVIEDVYSELFEVIQREMVNISPRDMWRQGVFILAKQVRTALAHMEERGIETERYMLSIDVPPEVAKANVDYWAEEANAVASTLKMQAHFRAVGEDPSPAAAARYGLFSNRTQLRVYGGTKNLFEAQEPKPDEQGEWRSLTNPTNLVLDQPPLTQIPARTTSRTVQPETPNATRSDELLSAITPPADSNQDKPDDDSDDPLERMFKRNPRRS